MTRRARADHALVLTRLGRVERRWHRKQGS